MARCLFVDGVGNQAYLDVPEPLPLIYLAPIPVRPIDLVRIPLGPPRPVRRIAYFRLVQRESPHRPAVYVWERGEL